MCGRPYPAAFGSEVELAEGSAAVVVTAAGVAAVAGVAVAADTAPGPYTLRVEDVTPGPYGVGPARYC